jgi:hypothetical protein
VFLVRLGVGHALLARSLTHARFKGLCHGCTDRTCVGKKEFVGSLSRLASVFGGWCSLHGEISWSEK